MNKETVREANRLLGEYEDVTKRAWNCIGEQMAPSNPNVQHVEQPDRDLQLAIDAFKRRRLAEIAEALNALGVDLDPPKAA